MADRGWGQFSNSHTLRASSTTLPFPLCVVTEARDIFKDCSYCQTMGPAISLCSSPSLDITTAWNGKQVAHLSPCSPLPLPHQIYLSLQDEPCSLYVSLLYPTIYLLSIIVHDHPSSEQTHVSSLPRADSMGSYSVFCFFIILLNLGFSSSLPFLPSSFFSFTYYLYLLLRNLELDSYSIWGLSSYWW